MLISLPSDSPAYWLAPLLAAGALSLVLTPLARAVAAKTGNIDRPRGEKIHLRPTPLMGGTAMYAAFAIAALIWLPLTGPVAGVLLGGLVAIGVGVADEYLDLSPPVHLGGQIAAAVVTIVAGVGVLRTISNPLSTLATPGVALPVAVGTAVTLIWIVGMMNTINFLDGLDGLAAGVSAIAALLLAAWALEPHPYLVPGPHHREELILPLLLAGAILGFLPFNWSPARIFMGDSGAMFLGVALAALSLVGPAKVGTALLVLAIPVLDVAWAIVRRQMKGRSFLSGDKQHVYHRMRDIGMTDRSIVLLLFLLVAALAILDLDLQKVTKLVAFLLLTVSVGAAFFALEIRAQKRDARGQGSEGSARVSARARE